MKKLADSNIWLALAISDHEFHALADSWLQSQPASGDVLFCRATQQSFLRLVTTAAVLGRYREPPLTNAEAWGQYESFLNDRRIAFQNEPSGLDVIWKAETARGSSSPKLWMDAYLAAFAMCGGFQLVTTDKGFKQYKGLELEVLSA